MNRTKAILAAGTFTGLILITILALGFGTLQAKSADNEALMPSAVEMNTPAVDNVSAEQALQEWQAYSTELEQTVQTLQQRETAYQQQLELANQTITTLQDQINNTNSAPSNFEEHEHEEHEEHEYGEYDD